MSTKSSKRVVGWFHRDEWRKVYQDLFAEDPVLQKHALDKIAVWKCRSLHKLSTAIECTAELVRARLLDMEQCNTYQVRLAMAMAVIRFVNLITEKYQNRAYAQAVHYLAEELGLPDWLVDLRHDATHSSLPSLPILHSAVNLSLQWLQENYWLVQLSEEPESSHSDNSARLKPQKLNPDTALCSAEQLLQEYLQVQATWSTTRKKEEGKLKSRPVRQILNDIERLAMSNRDEVLEVVIQDGFMISTTHQLGKCNIDAKDISESKEMHLPDDIIQTWRPLLKLFHHLRFTPQLLKALCGAVTQDSCVRNRLLVGWLILLLKNCKGFEELNKTEKIYNTACDIDCRQILEVILKSPNTYTSKLLTCIFSLDSCELEKSQQEQLQHCVDQYTGITQGQGNDSKGKVLTLEELVAENREVSENAEQNKPNSQLSKWTLATDIKDWSHYPLGSCPGSAVTYTSLELFTEYSTENYDSSDNSQSEMDYSDTEQQIYDIPVLSQSQDYHKRTAWPKEKIQTLADSVVLF